MVEPRACGEEGAESGDAGRSEEGCYLSSPGASVMSDTSPVLLFSEITNEWIHALRDERMKTKRTRVEVTVL